MLKFYSFLIKVKFVYKNLDNAFLIYTFANKILTKITIKMKKTNLFVCIIMLILISITMSCSSNKDIDEVVINTDKQIVGNDKYVSSVKLILNNTPTRGIQQDEAMLPDLIKSSKSFLLENGISYSDYFKDPEDPRIAVLALGMAEYAKTSSSSLTRTSLGGCVLEAVGVKDLGKAGAKAIAKRIGKAVLKRAVPYVGWGLFAIDMAMCLAD